MKYILLIFLLLSGLSLRANEEQVVLKTATGDIYGSLCLPAGSEKVPVALLIAGSGPTDRDGNNPSMRNNALKMIAESLRKNNIASLRFDKRGIAKSSDAMKREEDIRFEDYISDAKEWIQLLSQDKRFSKVIVIGHSEGALIGLLASIDNPNVSQYVSLAGVGEKVSQTLRRQLLDSPIQILGKANKVIDKLEKGELVEDVPAELANLFRPSVQPYLISCMRYDPPVEMARLQIPSLIVQGTTDIQIRAEDADALAAASPQAEKKIIENMNHVLKDCKAMDKMSQLIVYANPELPLNAEFVDTLIRFLRGIQ